MWRLLHSCVVFVRDDRMTTDFKRHLGVPVCFHIFLVVEGQGDSRGIVRLRSVSRVFQSWSLVFVRFLRLCLCLSLIALVC